ncbi:sensor histidine kinase [Butyricicoccus sp.]|uniref:sensor histidine kinase n=1 Tax=Butyricicoccus sp. TaxID=2049021 RepID=UPI003F1723B2
MKLGFRQKSILSMIFVSMIVSIALSAVLYNNSVDVIEENYTDSATNSLTVCAGMFDDMMREAYYTAINAAADTELQQLVQDYDSSAVPEILEQLASYRNGSIDSVYCFLPAQSLALKVTQSEQLAQPCSEEDVLWMYRLTDVQDDPLSPQYVTDETSVVKKQIFTYAKPVHNTTDGQTVGYIIVNVDERDVYFSCLQGHGNPGRGSGYIITPDGRVASGTNLKLLGTQRKEPQDSMLVTSVTAPLSQYEMTIVADRSVITGDITRTRNQIFLIALLLNLLACIPILVIVTKMLRPLKNLEETMDQVSQGDLTARTVVQSEDEIGRLSKGFNDMIGQVEDLIDQLVTEKLLKKEAEIEALKYQITPHFMYNTLNSIKYAAVLQNSSEIAEQLEAFIELLQLSASDRGAFITMEQEIHMVQNYTKLQLFRYANSFIVDFDVSPDIVHCYVPSLLIQPLVENAILHGIDLKKSDGRIVVRAAKEGDMLAISVEDNGRGMTEDDLNQLMSGERRSKFSGIGVRNVRERLQLYYGEKGKLAFYSGAQYGTVAVITMPASYDAEEYTI